MNAGRSESPAEQRPARLLIVDDQPVNIQALYQAFSDDHQVLMATSGAQALALAASAQPDLVLIDVVMPDMNGHEVCRRLKADPATRDIPVIFVTAHDDEAAEMLGLELGAVDFINKPISSNIVRARVKTHLTLKAQSDLLRQWVYIDGLTGVRNRRYFDERLATEWGRALRNGTALSVVLIDVDFFKRFNDAYGHPAGDECLRRVAGALRSACRRPVDVVARYGGEEFALILPGTTEEAALHCAAEAMRALGALDIEHRDSDVAKFVTLSLGIASCVPEADTRADTLIERADQALYAAKRAGRNMAVAFSALPLPGMPPPGPDTAAGIVIH